VHEPTPILDELLTVDQAAAWLKLRPKRVNELVREGKLPCVQLTARERRFTAEQLREFIASRTLTPPRRVDSPARTLLPSLQKEQKSQRGDRAQLREEMRRWR
jgi:excisionase family DNA binding protein